MFASTLTAGTAAAQPAPFNQIGVTMGHWHIASKDVEANKKLFLAMGGKLYMPGGNPLIMFPGLYINLNLGTEKGDGATQGSVVNHVGFIVDNVQKRVAQWKAAGVTVLPGGNNRLDQAFVVTPDGVRMEILEDKTQSMPIRNEHVHLSVTEAEVPKAQAWYAKTFGGKVGTRNDAPIVDLPGVQLRFAKADTKQAPTRGRVLDHIGFDVKDHAAFVKKIEAEGIKLDEPVRKTPTGSTITYITDPWGTRIEIVQRATAGAPGAIAVSLGACHRRQLTTPWLRACTSGRTGTLGICRRASLPTPWPQAPTGPSAAKGRARAISSATLPRCTSRIWRWHVHAPWATRGPGSTSCVSIAPSCIAPPTRSTRLAALGISPTRCTLISTVSRIGRGNGNLSFATFMGEAVFRPGCARCWPSGTSIV